MGQMNARRVRRLTVFLSLCVATVVLAFPTSRWAFSERIAPSASELDAARHVVARSVKADIRSFSTRRTFDRQWAVSVAPDPDAAPPVVYFASADPVDEANAIFDAVLADPAGTDLILRGGMNRDPLELTAGFDGEKKCLAEAVYFEARGETRAGQLAVAQVVLNRVRSPFYPKTICGVVYQNEDMMNRCQFSFACDGKAERIADRSSWRRAVDAAQRALQGEATAVVAGVGRATHYHAVSVSPRWAGEMNRLGAIGSHVFYRPRSGRSNS
jgi:hypothetical protein